jgi:hypothetical protein
MERKTKTIKLSNCEVDIVTSLTWGEKEDLRDILSSGTRLSGIKKGAKEEDISVEFIPAATSAAKYKIIELAVKEIRDGEKKLEYTKEWMRDLSQQDGDTLYVEINALQSGK